MNGDVCFFNPYKGFGFITAEIDNQIEDIFVHRSALPEPWKHRKFENLPCTFEIGEWHGKKTAIRVQILQNPASNGGSHERS